VPLGRKKLVELLIARGTPVEEPDAEPWATPWAWAEKMEQEAVLAVLREQAMSRRVKEQSES
jgi:hypothetical protein